MGKPGVIAFPVLLVLGAITGYLTYDMLVIQQTPVAGDYSSSPYRKDLPGGQSQGAASAQTSTEQPSEKESTSGNSAPTEESNGKEATSPPTSGKTINVDIVPGAQTKTTDAFSPNPVNANVGDTVVWTNKDTAIHTVTSGNPTDGPDGTFGGTADSPKLLSPNKTQEFTFTSAGEYNYYCTLHPTMVGKVTVS